MVDPTVGVTDQRKAIIVGLGEDMDTCTSTSTVHRASVYATTTFDGNTFSTPFVIDSVAGTTNALPLDHPHGDLERRVGAADIMHVAWWVELGDDEGIRYAAFSENATSATPVQLLAEAGSPPTVVATNNGRVLVFRGGGGFALVCEINSARTGCTDAGWQNISSASTLRFESASPIRTFPSVNNNIGIRDPYPISISVSESADVAFYCYQRKETNGDSPGDTDDVEELDVYCSSGSRDLSGQWTFSTSPLGVSGVNDDRDQFLPQVVATQESSTFATATETAIVTWYERSADPSNRYYQIHRTVSSDRFLTTAPSRVVGTAAASDPDYAPRHCKGAERRFVGDYNAAEPEVIHVFQPWITIPTPGVIGSRIDNYWSSLGSWRK